MKVSRKRPKVVLSGEEAVLVLTGECESCKSKDQFILYLQDEVAEYKARIRDLEIPTGRPQPDINEIPIKRGFISVQSKIREAALKTIAKRKEHKESSEDVYEKVEV